MASSPHYRLRRATPSPPESVSSSLSPSQSQTTFKSLRKGLSNVIKHRASASSILDKTSREKRPTSTALSGQNTPLHLNTHLPDYTLPTHPEIHSASSYSDSQSPAELSYNRRAWPPIPPRMSRVPPPPGIPDLPAPNGSFSPPHQPSPGHLRTPKSTSGGSGHQLSRTLSMAPSMANLTPRSILIAGATGRKSSLVISSIVSHAVYKSIKVLSFSERADATAQKMYAQIIKEPSSYHCVESPDTKALRKALEGIDVVFYNPPSGDANWVATAVAAIKVAKEVGVGHFVLYSVLHPQLSKLLHHADRVKVEEQLIESGLNYTILQPGIPMQNVDVRTIVTTSQYTLPYPHTTLQSFVDIHDLAFVIRKIMLNPEPHNRATYELVGQTCTHEDIARDVGVYSNKTEIECVRIDRRDFLGDDGANEYEADVMERTLLYYERRGVTGNSNTLRWLLGRAPTSFSVMLHRDYHVSDYQDAYLGIAE